MTEAEWLACADPTRMLELMKKAGLETGDPSQPRPPPGQPLQHPGGRLRDLAELGRMATRKGVLFSCACVWRVGDRLAGLDLSELVKSWEAIADSQPEGEEPILPHDDEARPPPHPGDVRSVGYWAARRVVRRAPVLVGGVWIKERRAQAALLRDIMGNPFRPSPPLPPAVLAWNDGTVRRLAQAAYDERRLPAGTLDAARLAILADALLDAGCEDEELIGHCRSAGPHVRGCWAVDLILGKE